MGPNRVGKSTLLALPEFLRLAVHESVNEAVRRVFDGPAYLRHFGVPATEVCSVGVTTHDYSWDIDITISGGGITPLCAEKLQERDSIVLARQPGSVMSDSHYPNVNLGTHSIPMACAKHYASLYEQDRQQWLNDDAWSPFPGAAGRAGTAVAVATHDFSAYQTYKYSTQHLATYGSIQSDDTTLHPDGSNAFPLLRNWRDNSDTEARFDFIVSTMREAFPRVRRLDFEQAGQTVTIAIRDDRWPDRKIPISRESTGFVTALLQLCAVASTEKYGLVTIDELETSLHPHAIRTLIAAFRRWAEDHELRIVLATQSETVLDQFRDEPSKIFVIEPGQTTTPRPLTDLFDETYLAQFSVGDLFAQLEYGSNHEESSSS